MPLYAYECGSCGVKFERMQKFTDKPIKRCPECSKNSVERVIQPSGIIFKGSGWYKTDSRSSSSASIPAGKSKKSESKPSESKSSESSSSSSASSSSDE
ncbi:MAG: zinc ribbon domain-containing protein [Chloroflexota bacterium]